MIDINPEMPTTFCNNHFSSPPNKFNVNTFHHKNTHFQIPIPTILSIRPSFLITYFIHSPVQSQLVFQSTPSSPSSQSPKTQLMTTNVSSSRTQISSKPTTTTTSRQDTARKTGKVGTIINLFETKKNANSQQKPFRRTSHKRSLSDRSTDRGGGRVSPTLPPVKTVTKILAFFEKLAKKSQKEKVAKLNLNKLKSYYQTKPVEEENVPDYFSARQPQQKPTSPRKRASREENILITIYKAQMRPKQVPALNITPRGSARGSGDYTPREYSPITTPPPVDKLSAPFQHYVKKEDEEDEEIEELMSMTTYELLLKYPTPPVTGMISGNMELQRRCRSLNVSNFDLLRAYRFKSEMYLKKHPHF